MDQKRYKDSIEFSALESDLKLLPDADDSMLGDKGINLSGGQKMRLSIARSLYADKDIVLMDDPISALDVGVGKFIMEECILKYLKGKTRVISTHAISYLRYFDYIYIIDEGKIVESGDYDYIRETKQYKEIYDIYTKKEEEIDEDKEKKGLEGHLKTLKKMNTISKKISKEKSEKVKFDFDGKDDSGKGKSTKDQIKRMNSELCDDMDAELPDIEDLNSKTFSEQISRQVSLAKGISSKLEIINQASRMDESDDSIETTDSANLKKEDEKKKIEDVSDNKLLANIISDEEEGIKNQIDWALFKRFMMAKATYMIILLDIGLLCGQHIRDYFMRIYQKNWAEEPAYDKSITNFLMASVLCGVVDISIMFVRQYYVHAESRMALHKRLDLQINFQMIHASVNKFWDRVPIGRVLSRLGGDVVEAGELYDSSNRIVECAVEWMKCLLVLVFSSHPYILIFVALSLYLFNKVKTYWQKCELDLAKIRSSFNNKCNQQLSELLRGINTVRAFGKEEDSIKDMYANINNQKLINTMCHGVYSWYEIRAEFLGMVIIVPGLLLCLWVMPSVAVFSLFIDHIFRVEHMLNWGMHTLRGLEHHIRKFQRCMNYMEIEPEFGYNNLDEIYKDVALKHDINNQIITSKDVNSDDMILKEIEHRKISTLRDDFEIKEGVIEFENYGVRYRENLDMVLKGIDLKIKSKEKIGIVGRTGAGKTTLLSSIYKTFQEYQGQLKIDGVDISNIDLRSLRKHMTIIPQDPHLFDDTLKNNLDPLNEFNNEDIIKILKDLEIWEKFEKDGGVFYKIDGEGKNLSQGEKQLLCMSRALLNKNKLVLLDEATASIDIITEQKIQKAVEKFFNDSTILIIAHRLNTIMFCDKVLVLEKGLVSEFDDIEALKSNPESVFGKMVAMSNEVEKYMG